MVFRKNIGLKICFLFKSYKRFQNFYFERILLLLKKVLILSLCCRPGIEFITEENSPRIFPLTYTYPKEVQEVYLHQQKFDPVLDKLKAETAFLKPPYRSMLYWFLLN